MKAYMVVSRRMIEPFGEHPRDCLIVNRKLSALQEDALASQNLSLVRVNEQVEIDDPDEHLVFDDFVYFTPELLREFVARSRKLQRHTEAAMKPGVSTLRCMASAQDVRRREDQIVYRLHYVPARDYRGAATVPVVMDTDRITEFVPMPAHLVEGGEYHVPLTDRLLIQIEHWSALYAANIATLLARTARVMNKPRLELLFMALKAGSFNKWSVLRQANHIGRGCDIHPTAYVEGSTIGNSVKIGAGAIVRESVVGDRTYIANNASVELSAIGEGCELQGGAVVQYSVLYPGAFTFAKGINASFLGRDTFVGEGAALADFRFDGRPVTVLSDGKKVDTGNTFLGACLGHGVYLGSGCIVAPGRTIPNGMRINPEESRIIVRCVPGLEVKGHRLTEASLPRDSRAD